MFPVTSTPTIDDRCSVAAGATALVQAAACGHAHAAAKRPSRSTWYVIGDRLHRLGARSWRIMLTKSPAADFFVVPTATCRLLFVLVILAHERRRVVHLAVTYHPTAARGKHHLCSRPPFRIAVHLRLCESEPPWQLRSCVAPWAQVGFLRRWGCRDRIHPV